MAFRVSGAVMQGCGAAFPVNFHRPIGGDLGRGVIMGWGSDAGMRVGAHCQRLFWRYGSSIDVRRSAP